MIRSAAVHVLVVLAGLSFAVGLDTVVVPGRARGATPEPTPNSSVSMVAEPMLGGSFRSGSWGAVRVQLENDGPVVDGELTLSEAVGGSTFSVPVQLATGARQEHLLYGQVRPFGNRFRVDLVSGGAVVSSVTVPVAANDGTAPGVYLIAEHPERLVGSIRTAAAAGGGTAPDIVPLAPEDLPPRVEVWSSIDVLVWQDVDSNRLGNEQLAALEIWALTGGHLVIVGGSTGVATLGAFPADLLPYGPVNVIEVPVADLATFLGGLPATAAPMPALTGPLERGVALARSGDAVVAARNDYGDGTVTLVGLDPTTQWLADSTTASGLWARVMPSSLGSTDPTPSDGDEFLVNALSNLPAIQLPRLDFVFVLFVVYIVAIGPLNYFLLRRRDRREWAWLTMPATIVVFALAAYGFGVAFRGANVVVNELAIVHGAAGTERGLAEVYVGIYSPNRADFDVKVGGGVLISAPAGGPSRGEQSAERPLDVVLGDPATVRHYGIGFGALRAFRAQAMATTPRIDAALSLVDGTLEGTLTNSSSDPLADVSLVYGNAAEIVGDMLPGEVRTVRLSTLRADVFDQPLSWRLFPELAGTDPSTIRTVAARRAVIQQLGGGWNEGISTSAVGSFAKGPVILAWRSGSTLDIDVGSAAEHVGERLYVLPARASVSGPVVFSGGLIQHSGVSSDADEAFEDGATFYLSRGTIAVDYRPVDFDGSFEVAGMSLRLGGDRVQTPAATGEALVPLPADEQPDPEQPLASDPRAGDGAPDIPRLQLFDRVAGTWIEFEPVARSRTYVVVDPARYVDESGAFRVRFVLRGREYTQFTFAARLEGTVE